MLAAGAVPGPESRALPEMVTASAKVHPATVVGSQNGVRLLGVVSTLRVLQTGTTLPLPSGVQSVALVDIVVAAPSVPPDKRFTKGMEQLWSLLVFLFV